MLKFIVEGGHPLSGAISVKGNKNAALPCIAACLLTSEPMELKNIPDIEDVHIMLEILRHIGVDVTFENNTATICAKNVSESTIPRSLAQKIRASILFAGPLLSRCKEAHLYPPGGDIIGKRRLDTHFLALKELGAHITIDETISFSAGKLSGTDLFLDEASVTATENTIMAAVLAEGNTVIENAASEPHVQDLCNMLISMGARITGVGSNILYISGVSSLRGTPFSIGSDYMEIGSLIGLGAITGAAIQISPVQPRMLNGLGIGFGKLGISWTYEDDVLILDKKETLRIVPDFGNAIPKIDDAPWPGFPPDLTSIATVTATQVEGTILIHEKMFESRMFFVDKLIEMGARIVLCDPHRAVVIGPTQLHPAELTSPDVRAGMAMLIAALIAPGKSVINNIYQIDRGYEHIHERLSLLGARITRVNADD